jgi:hypothetical protein
MTAKSDFTEEEWKLVTDGPAVAGMVVLTAEKGGSIRETFALAKGYAEARKQQGESELLDEIVSAGPGHATRYDSPEKLHEQGLQRLSEAVGLLEQKATPDELEGYRAFVLNLASRVAHAHEEGDEKVSASEQAAIDEITASLGTAGGA